VPQYITGGSENAFQGSVRNALDQTKPSNFVVLFQREKKKEGAREERINPKQGESGDERPEEKKGGKAIAS